MTSDSAFPSLFTYYQQALVTHSRNKNNKSLASKRFIILHVFNAIGDSKNTCEVKNLIDASTPSSRFLGPKHFLR